LEGEAAARARAIRTHLAFIVAACVVPAALLGAALVGYDYYKRERARVVRDSTATARALGAAVDMELSGVKSALYALATSPHLAAGDYAAFHAQASAALKDQNFDNVVLLDESGRQLVNTLRPYGTALPASGNPSELQQIFKTGKAVITDLFTGPVAQRPLIAVGVPVVVDGRVRYTLNAGVSAERVYVILGDQHLPPDWIGAVFDRDGTVVARTSEAKRFVGHKGSPELVQRMKEVREDAFQSTTLEGIPVLTVFSRAAGSGWTVALGIPEQALYTQLWYSMARLMLVTMVMLGIALGLAIVLSGRLVRIS
jgi:hypothetical protein